MKKPPQFSTALFLLTVAWFSTPASAQEDTLDDLLRIEAKVQASVSKTMPAVVAVTDGQGSGSGVIVSETGLVLTAGHVMASPYHRGYEVTFPDGSVAKAKPLGKNLNVDAGMVQIIDPGKYPFVKIAARQPQKGDWVITLGHSGGYEIGRKPPVRTGRVLGYRNHQMITDAVLIGGDSGGPLFNLDGEVIGIHSSIGDSIAENRHVTIDTFRKHWTRMQVGDVWGELPELSAKNKKKRARAKLGIVVDRNADNARIKEIHPGGPASRAGILPGDIVTRFDGKPISDSKALIDLIKTKSPEVGYNVEIQRNGNYFTLYIVLDKF